MQDLAASFPSLKSADDLTAPSGRTADESIRRIWQQPLGDVHVRLNNIVSPASLLVRFDTTDTDFVFDLGAHWPISSDYTASVYEADIVKLADALNDLMRLYAIETGHTRMHVLIEARRGQFAIPGWWQESACLFATYAFDTNFAEVGLFTHFNDAYADMELLNQPHRLLVAIGPATPELLDVDPEKAWIDPDKERLRSLKRWNQQMALQINMLMADIFGGGEDAMNAVVDALSRVRGLSGRLSDHILRLEKRAYRPTKNKDQDRDLQIPPVSRKAGRLVMTEAEPALAETLADLRGALTEEAHNQAVAPAMRLELQKGLRTLNTLEGQLASGDKPKISAAPAVKRQARVIRPALQKIVRKSTDRRQQLQAFGAYAPASQNKRVQITPRRLAAPVIKPVQQPAVTPAQQRPAHRRMGGPKF